MLRRLIWRPALPAAPATTPSPLLRLPNYFARPREESLLTRQLRGTPRLTVVLGAGMSGKSAVLTQVLQPWLTSAVYVDLRQHSFADWSGFYQLLAHHFSTWGSAATAVERVMPEELTLPFGLGAI